MDNSQPQVEITMPDTPLSTDNPHPETLQNDEISTQEAQTETTEPTDSGSGLERQPEPEETKPKHPGGRPCEYCKRKDEIDRLTREYLEQARNKTKPIIPYIEELAEILEIDRGVVYDWADKKTPDGELEHSEFNHTIKRFNNIQRLRLLQRTTGRFNPTGAIFQLKANHGMIETEKQIHAGDPNEPIEIVITEEKKIDE